MAYFQIEGGKKLSGEITPQGAKNEALQVISAVLLSGQKIQIDNVPYIRDVIRLIELLDKMGVETTQNNPHSYTFQAKNIDIDFLYSEEFAVLAGSLRGSIMILGPLLARFGSARIPKPGGDKIGRRNLDAHFLGFQKLGATFNYCQETHFYEVASEQLRGCYIHMEEASVTGTANIIMAASLAEGTTTIYNAACEPYIQQLCSMLVSMGVNISGIASNLLTIEGTKKLSGTSHTILPDMIEIGSFISVAAMTGSDILIKDAAPKKLGIIPDAFRKLGIQIDIRENDIHIPAQEHYSTQQSSDGSILTISDAIWPGLTPDLLSVILVTSIQANGTVLIHQKMFESRLFFVDKLIDMGAQIILCDPHRATVIGIDRKYALRSTIMTSPDIRAGISLLIAALTANGTSIIKNVEQIDRGYQFIEERLNKLGAKIVRFQ